MIEFKLIQSRVFRLVLLALFMGSAELLHAKQPEIELLISETRSIDEITPFNLLPKESLHITVNRLNGQLLQDGDLTVAWHCPGGTFKSLGERQVMWTAPSKNGVYPIDLVIKWKELILTRRVTALVLIPVERHQKGKYLVENKKHIVKTLKKFDLETTESESEEYGGLTPFMVGPAGLKSLKYYAETLPSRILSVKPRSRLYERRDFYLKIPQGLIEVTRDNEETHVTPHFQLKDFKCKGEKSGTQYICLDPNLLMKLEAIEDELGYLNIPCDKLTIMSGFRSPPYNKKLGNVKFSRHTYGDAADIFIDQDHNGKMDDINRDGKIDVKDAKTLRSVIERVEERGAPIGGIGIYPPNKKTGRGPFVHVDTRGFRARW